MLSEICIQISDGESGDQQVRPPSCPGARGFTMISTARLQVQLHYEQCLWRETER
jgi:hypothetical protein